MSDIILHADANCFYASVEMNENPELKGKKVAVCGSTENRHGIVLTASYPAKRSGVKTGMANWEAKQACPGLIAVPPHYELYLKYSKYLRSIYLQYSNDVEPFGMDENWIAIRGVSDVEGKGRKIADEIRQRVKDEIGITVSVGVSYSKIFAKLGSDMRKPDGTTVISRANFKDTVWPLPASDLLYVGPATTRKLALMNIHTIGELANCDPTMLRYKFGKVGMMLWLFANGNDGAQVMPKDYTPDIKSVGHGVTCVHDLESDYEVWLVMLELSQDIGHRTRKHGITVKGVQITVKDCDLGWQQYQTPLPFPTQSPLEIAQAAYALFCASYNWNKPVRAITVRGINPGMENAPVQLDMFDDYAKREKRKAFDDAIDEIRRRFGYGAIRSASLLGDLKMANDKCETVTMPGIIYR